MAKTLNASVPEVPGTGAEAAASETGQREAVVRTHSLHGSLKTHITSMCEFLVLEVTLLQVPLFYISDLSI